MVCQDRLSSFNLIQLPPHLSLRCQGDVTMEPANSLKELVRNRDVKGILRTFFAGEPPTLQTGFNREDQLWDFKEVCPALGKGNEVEWAKISADVLAFHNQEGGVIFFGIRDSDYRFVGTGIPLDTKLFNDKIRK